MTKQLIDSRNWLDPQAEPTKQYYIKLYDGSRGQADTALHLFDLICDPTYSECEDRQSHLMMLAQKLKDVAAFDLSAMGFRAQVHSGVGVFYDNGVQALPDEIEEAAAVKFENQDDPIILDFWNEWTTMASLITCGYLKLFVKDGENLSDPEDDWIPEWLVTFENMPGNPSSEAPAGYLEILPATIEDEPTWIPHYVRIQDRDLEVDDLHG
ncbi:hypothetical protein ACFSR7_06190 [Cohnella sp. GCM10020058]|uniref:hypothetical protein n=1 Tax=Cohnella sp. GCM10020058 TaxID=3317330 RepID=UPI003642E810